MLNWLPYPMVRASLCFTSGIFIGLEYCPPPGLAVLWIWLIAFYWLALKTPGILNPAWHQLRGTAALVLFFMAGMVRTQSEAYRVDESVGQAELYRARVITPSEVRGNYCRTVLSLHQVWLNGREEKVNDHLLWYQSVEEAYEFIYGSEVVIRGTPQRINPPANPLEFDYAAFMSRKNIFWQQWSRSGSTVSHSLPQAGSLMGWCHGMKNYLKSQLQTVLPAGHAQEIAMAMLLGDRAMVSDGLEEAFADSGTIHILAVSGLHLGILYGILLQFFGDRRNHRWFKWVFLLSCLLVLWSFTMLTGMAPSTQRAATMFSVMLLARVFSQQDNTVNTLALSALAILWVNPYQLYSVGFQLSFGALAGILYLQPRIVSWWKAPNRIGKYFWDLVAVSLSAQIAVLPLSIFYFHQVPVYFLLANLLLVPLAFGIVAAGIFLFVFSATPLLAQVMATLLSWLTTLAGFIVNLVANLPHSTWQRLYFNKYELLIYYGIMVTGVVFLQTRSRVIWHLLLVMLSSLVLVNAYNGVANLQRYYLTIYQLPGHSAMDFVAGRRFYSAMDPDLRLDTTTIDYKISNYRNYHKLLPGRDPFVVDRKDAIPVDQWIFRGKRIVLIKAPPDHWIGSKIKLKSHIVVVSNNSITRLDQLSSRWLFDLLVIDGSNGKIQARKLEQQARAVGLQVHNCWEKGYKKIKL